MVGERETDLDLELEFELTLQKYTGFLAGAGADAMALDRREEGME